MTLTFYRLLLVSLLAMTFVSQSFAGLVLACQDMSEIDHSPKQMASSKQINSEEHHHIMMAKNTQNESHDMSNMTSGMECCEQDCQCPVTGFTSYAASESNPKIIITVENNKVSHVSFSALNISLSLPIKPPTIA